MRTPNTDERRGGFAITRGKGFHVSFENGWTVSVQFGGGNYCDNYDDGIGREVKSNPSTTAEVAILSPSGELIELPDGDTVLGWQTPAQVLSLLIETAERPSVEALESDK